MAGVVAQLDDIKRRTYEGWQRPANLPYLHASASSSSRSSRGNILQSDVNGRISKETKTPNFATFDQRSAIADEVYIEDITDVQDAGYDADVEVQYPDEYDELNTDEEKLNEIDVDPSEQNEAGLVERFERLLREDQSWPCRTVKPWCEEKRRVAPRKRTHSQNSNISSDYDTGGTINAHGTMRDTKHYQRKRKTYHARGDPPSHPDGDEKNLNDVVLQDAMDVD